MKEYVAVYTGSHQIPIDGYGYVTLELERGDVVDLVSMRLWLAAKKKAL